MRNISFMLTQEQIRCRTKTVTRRLGWRHLKPGDLLSGVEKGMGLKKGESIKRLAIIRVVSVRFEPLRQMVEDGHYGIAECAKEGFGDHPELCRPDQFIKFFCASHKGCTPETEVTRIEFEYVN
jgi:hypothetical protein